MPEIFALLACVAVLRSGFDPRVCPSQKYLTGMAKTKKTERRSTRGKAPQKQLVMKAARLSREQKDASETMMWKLSNRSDVKELSKSTAGPQPYPYHVWVGSQLRSYGLSLTDMAHLFGLHIPIHLGVRRDRGILIDELSQFGLTDSFDNNRTNDLIDEEAWDIESICSEDDK